MRKKQPQPWLTHDIKAQCHGILDDILNHSSTPAQFEEICERIRNVDDARTEREELIDRIYELISTTNTKEASAAMNNVYKAFWKLENKI